MSVRAEKDDQLAAGAGLARVFRPFVEFEKTRRRSLPFADRHRACSCPFRRLAGGGHRDGGARLRNANHRSATGALARLAGLLVGARDPVAIRTVKGNRHPLYRSPPRGGKQSTRATGKWPSRSSPSGWTVWKA